MIKNIFLILLLVFATTSCTTLPPPADFELKPKARIGVISELSEKIGQIHFRTGFAPDINVVYKDFYWGLNDHLQSEFKRVLAENDYEYVEVSSNQINEAGFRYESFFEIKDNSWILMDDALPSINYLRKELGLDALLSFKHSAYQIEQGCSSWGCNYRTINNAGSYTTGDFLFQVLQSNGIFPFRKNVTILSPPTPIMELEYIGGRLGIFEKQRPNPHSKKVKGKLPKKIGSISEEEWARIESTVKLLITETVEREVKLLKAGSKNK